MPWSIYTERLAVEFCYDNFRLLRAVKLRLYAALGFVVWPFISPASIDACAVCLTGANDSVTDAFNWSVLFLMATPYAVVGSIAGWLFFVYRRAARAHKQLDHEGPEIKLAWNHKESGR